MNKKHHITFVSEMNESLRMALGAIAAHKLRSALTLLGVLVGVLSIIVVMTAMRVMQANIERQLSSLGSTTFMIRKWPNTYFTGISDTDWQRYGRRKNITLTQVRQLQDKLTLPASVGAETTFWSGEISTRYKTSAPTVRLYGETPGSFPAHNWNVGEGRSLLDADVDSARSVCVLGYGLATNMFPNSSPVGEDLKIGGVHYSIIGVLEPKGGAMGGDQDNFIVMPITTGLNRYGGWWYRSLNLLVAAPDRESLDAVQEEVCGTLRVLRKVPPGKDDDFEISSNDSLIEQFKNFTRNVRIGVAIVSSIALLAAGIGIMNIMLVSVTERTREIGIRRAIGAKKRNIMVQFIMEAIALCEVGGAIGVVLGILGGNVLALVMKLPPVIPVDWIIIGLTICSFVGVIFGTYPAWKAANLDPIESLRYE
jgi:putative ABC transport system permease protein